MIDATTTTTAIPSIMVIALFWTTGHPLSRTFSKAANVRVSAQLTIQSRNSTYRRPSFSRKASAMCTPTNCLPTSLRVHYR